MGGKVISHVAIPVLVAGSVFVAVHALAPIVIKVFANASSVLAYALVAFPNARVLGQ